MTDGIEEGVLAMLVVEPKATPRQFVWPAPPDDDAAPLGVTSLAAAAGSARARSARFMTKKPPA